ncbi:MAG: phage holin family protein [Oscillospiraceae bacterium]|nr:phage holin family protein [Oscillospiraceae bacterium]
MIRLYITRYISCAAALAAGCWLSEIPLEPSLFGWAALLAALYAVVKPLYSLLAAPLDMLLFGLGTLCLDALMIWLAMPYEFFYWQTLALAAAVMVCFIPYERWRAMQQ